jgi:hypothetical protein
VGDVEVAADRQHDPVAGTSDVPTPGGLDVGQARLIERLPVLPKPGPELAPALSVVGRGDAERRAVIESWTTGDSHLTLWRPRKL